MSRTRNVESVRISTRTLGGVRHMVPTKHGLAQTQNLQDTCQIYELKYRMYAQFALGFEFSINPPSGRGSCSCVRGSSGDGCARSCRCHTRLTLGVNCLTIRSAKRGTGR